MTEAMAARTSKPSRSSWVAGLAWALCLPLLVALGRSSVVIEDEFLSIAHAVEAMQGAVLYRDRFEFTGPLSHWALVLLVPLGFGPLATAHALLALVVAWMAEQLRRLAALHGASPWLAGWVAVALLAGPLRLWPAWSHHWAVWPWLLWLWWLAARALRAAEEARWPWPLWAAMGLCWALAFASLQPDGALVGVALVGVAWLGCFALHPSGRKAFQALAWLALGLALALGGVLGVWALQGALRGGIEGTLLFPFTGYKQPGGINDLPWFSDLAGRLNTEKMSLGWALRSMHLLGLYAMVVLLPLVVLPCWWLRAAWQPWAWSRDKWLQALPIAAALASLMVAFLGRADAVHVATSSPPALVLAALCVAWGWRQADALAWRKRWLRGALGLLAALWLAAGWAWWVAEWRAQPAVWSPWPSPDERVKKAPALQWLAHHLQPGDRMVALPYAGVYISYLAPSASPWLLLFPPSWGYNGPKEWAAHWQSVARLQAACVLVAPWPPLRPGGVAPWIEGMPPGYRLVATLPPLHPSWGVPWLVYGRAGWPVLPKP